MPQIPKQSNEFVVNAMEEDAKKIKSSKARIVTRRINELTNGIKCNSGKVDIN